MDKTGRNGLRVGDISTPDFKEKYEKLKRKHIQILNFYDFEYELDELETTWFDSSLNTLKQVLIILKVSITFIMQLKEREKNIGRRCSRDTIRY